MDFPQKALISAKKTELTGFRIFAGTDSPALSLFRDESLYSSIAKWKQFSFFLPHLPNMCSQDQQIHILPEPMLQVLNWIESDQNLYRLSERETGFAFSGHTKMQGCTLAELEAHRIWLSWPLLQGWSNLVFSHCRSCNGRLTWATWGALESFLLSTWGVRVFTSDRDTLVGAKGPIHDKVSPLWV